MKSKNNNLLFVVAMILGFFVVSWAYFQWQAAKTSFSESNGRKIRCLELLNEIEFLKERNQSFGVIAPSNFDPSLSVINAAQDAGIPTEDFFINQTSLRQLEGMEAREWKVEIPEMPMTLKQASKFVRILSDSEMKFQVDVVKFQKLDQDDSQHEHWSTDVDVRYIKAASD